MAESTETPPQGLPEQHPDELVPPAESPGPTVKDRLAALESEAALEREQWLRERFAREHQVLLSMMRLLISGVSTESRLMRFWRWLIDDYRSERRLLAKLNGESDEERLDMSRVLTWFRGRGFGREYSERGG